MDRKKQRTFLLLTTVLAGLLAGFFYTWSFTIMQSLDLIDESTASVAMNSINANIRNGWFAVIFFGTPVTTILSLLMIIRLKQKEMYPWVLLAAVFAVATFVITFTIHLPLNAELTNGQEWSSYVGPWVQWNHARTATSLLSFISMTWTMVSHGRLQERI